jgi:glycine/D-amino acid oxidase-like deaminating enzyme
LKQSMSPDILRDHDSRIDTGEAVGVTRGAADPWAAKRSLAEASPLSFWLDSPQAPEPALPFYGRDECDLAVVGGGLTGAWTALLAKERDPARDVVLLEGGRIGWQASGRNGGFCMATLTHGGANGLSHFPEELETLDRLGLENLDEVERAVARYDIDCDWRRTGEISVAVAPWQVGELAETRDRMVAAGQNWAWLDGAAVRAQIASPTYLAGLWNKDRCAMVDPARLVWGLARAAQGLGARVHEHTRVENVERRGAGLLLHTPGGVLSARRVMLATNALPGLLPAMRRRVVPVYDYALMTEPLSDEQWAAVGWRGHQGVADAGNRFHYYRRTADGRILWGGYDAVYHYGSAVRAELERRPQTFEKLAAHFVTTFPQLQGLRFTHAWAGAIDTCTRLCQFWGTAHGGRVAYALGYTGMGVGESRFGASVALDLLDGVVGEHAGLKLTTTKPVPWPPEPLRSAVVGLTSWSLGRADASGGRRNVWLRALDRLGLGFDS